MRVGRLSGRVRKPRKGGRKRKSIRVGVTKKLLGKKKARNLAFNLSLFDFFYFFGSE